MITSATPATPITATESASTVNRDKPGNLFNPNARFISTATKLQGWINAWYNPEMQLRKLKGDNQINLTKQSRCKGCKGSGHKSGDDCCLLKAKKLNTIQAIPELDNEAEQAENA